MFSFCRKVFIFPLVSLYKHCRNKRKIVHICEMEFKVNFTPEKTK